MLPIFKQILVWGLLCKWFSLGPRVDTWHFWGSVLPTSAILSIFVLSWGQVPGLLSTFESCRPSSPEQEGPQEALWQPVLRGLQAPPANIPSRKGVTPTPPQSQTKANIAEKFKPRPQNWFYMHFPRVDSNNGFSLLNLCLRLVPAYIFVSSSQ